MEEETIRTEEDNNFPLNISEIAKLIEEKITKSVYKFKYDDSEETPEQDFNLRFNCIQGWFIRCSFKTKVDFLKKCAMQVNELNLLIMIINTLYTVSSKDRIYSLARGNFNAVDMKMLPDHNRCLHKATLEKVMANEINWFKTLSDNKQYIFLIKLISLADGLVVINNLFAHFIEVLKIRSKSSSKKIKSSVTFCSRSTVASSLPFQSEEKLKETIHSYFQKVIPVKSSENSLNSELSVLLLKWKQFISKYNEQICAFNSGHISEGEKNSVKSDKGIPAIDSIQRHPVWVTMPILEKLENLQIMNKVNDFWVNTIKELRSELQARKVLDKEITALEDQIKNIHFHEIVSKPTPELRVRMTDVVKPSFHKKLTPKNMVTHYSLICEVYNDYLEDFNLYSKKLQSFPRAMNLNKQKR